MTTRSAWMVMSCVLAHGTIGRAQPSPTPPPPPAAEPAIPVAPPAPSAKPPAVQLEVHGFAGGSLYVQDAGMGPTNGGGAWYVTGEPAHDKWSFGGDVRQTRLNLSVAGAPVFHGAVPKATIELDLFGGNGAGAFGDVSVLPRLRLAYAELKWGQSTLQFGQTHSLVLAMTPATVGHIAFPLTYAAGTIGWRFPGIFVYHTIALPGQDTSLELAAMVARAAWQNPSNAPFADTAPGSGDGKPFVSQDAFGVGLGEASGLPQVEVRAKLKSPRVEGFVAGHAHRVDRTGTGITSGPQIDLDVLAADAGFKLNLAPLTVQGSGYVGKNLAPLVGSLLQFQGPTRGDIHEWGVWGQAGYAIDNKLGVWALAAESRPRQSELRNAGLTRLRNAVVSGMIRYQEAGYAFGLELTRWYTRKAAGVDVISLSGDQIMLSANYTF